MTKRTKQLFPPGTLPPLGVIPEKMYAWTLRCERLGKPINAFKEEIVPVPELKSNEVLVANMSLKHKL